MNTATYRVMAAKAERNLDWRTAAQWWQSAIDKYPTAGALADADKAKMHARRAACLGMLSSNHANHNHPT